MKSADMPTSDHIDMKVENNNIVPTVEVLIPPKKTPSEIPLITNMTTYTNQLAHELDVKLDRVRWVVLLVFCLINVSYNSLWITFSSISDIAVRYYKIEPLVVDWLSMSFLMAFILLALPSAIFLSSYGLRATILVAAILHTVGTFIRYMGTDVDGFGYISVGQLFIAAAGPFVLAIPPELAAVWFGEHERAIATSIGMLMGYVGVAVGFLQPTLMVPDSKDFKSTRDGIQNLLWFQAAFSSITLVLVVLFVKERPSSPPSLSQALRDKKQDKMNLSFFSSLKCLAKNLDFHLTSQAYGIMYGMLTVISTLLNQLVKAKFRTIPDSQIGIMGFIATLIGIVGILLFGLWIEAYQLYKATAIFVYIVGTLCLIGFGTSLLVLPNYTLVFLSFCVFNVVAVPYTSFGLEQIAEITYPLSEFTTCTVAMMTGNLYGLILTYVFGWMVEMDLLKPVNYGLVALSALGLILVLFAKVPMKRTEMDHAQKAEKKLLPKTGMVASNESGYESTMDQNSS